MKAIEFQSQLNADHSLSVPPSVAAGIPFLQPLRVLVLVPEADEDQQWEHLAALEFGQGYADTDTIYNRP